MKYLLHRTGMAVATLALAAVLFTPGVTQAEGWGTAKRQVVCGGGAIPPNDKADVNKDQAHCLAKAPIRKNERVVSRNNRGPRWVLVWLTGRSGARKAA